ncbi:hypothetical protein PR048_009981 [Dryococelus australis]|uniref:Uncharacterized protein n=1 Tax=Dryococelus australis TaxID=614101 RepID=A0ABQ9I1H7_9NEOP|nr:hypothetical protein PR048_009981 [Dryococelus australis]
MLKRLLVLKETIVEELASDPNFNVDSLTASKWKQIDGIVEVLEPIAQATEDTSSERYPTLELVIPLLQGIQYVLRNHVQQQKPETVFAQNLCKSLKSQFPLAEQDRLYMIATAVDPRIKMEALPDDSKVLAKQYFQDKF